MIKKNQVPFVIRYTHLSKGTSDLGQKCTQLMTPLWDTVFHAPLHSVTHFVNWVLAPETSFSSKIRNFHFKVFRANTQNKICTSHHVKKQEKLCLEMVSEIVCNIVWGQLCLLKDVRLKSMFPHFIYLCTEKSCILGPFPPSSRLILASWIP